MKASPCVMVEFTAAISKFKENGDKTGWTYIEVPADIAQQVKPGYKKAFKVKGLLDAYRFAGKTVLPMGAGRFILALDATVRKNIQKGKGAMVRVQLEEDSTPHTIPDWIIECLEDEPVARERFYKMARSHQNYFIKWVESAKTEETRTKRMALSVTSISRGLDFGEMIRMNRENKLS